MVIIYVLKCPISNEIRYVGATSRTLRQRLSAHLTDAKKLGGTYKINWIKGLINNGLKPLIEQLEICTMDNWKERENYWYNYYKQLSSLTNTNRGGQGVYKKDTNSIERSRKAKFKPILQYSINGNFIKEWESISDATTFYKLSRNSIKNNLRGDCSSSGGYIWKYKNKEIELKRRAIPNKEHRSKDYPYVNLIDDIV